MPFIKRVRRDTIDLRGIEALDIIEPGDRCYKFYKAMVEQWKAEPRWTTAHNIMKDAPMQVYDSIPDDMVAQRLAWEVFFQLYVMPYELKKRKENGDI